MLDPHRQIVQAGGTDQRHPGRAGVKADAALFQPAHDAAGRVQPKGAAPAEQHRVDPVRHGGGAQQLRLPRGRAAAPDIEAGRRARRAEQDGAAGRGGGVLGLTDPDVGKGSDGDLNQLKHKGRLLFGRNDLFARLLYRAPAPGATEKRPAGAERFS